LHLFLEERKKNFSSEALKSMPARPLVKVDRRKFGVFVSEESNVMESEILK
jgi:hypothetical protein